MSPPIFDAGALLDALRSVVRDEIREALREQASEAPPEPLPELETFAQFAQRCRCSSRTVIAWSAAGLPTVGNGRGKRVRVAPGLKWLEARGGGGAAAEAARRAVARLLGVSPGKR